MKFQLLIKKTGCVLLVSAFLSLWSCRDFLEEKPLAFISGTELYTSATNIELALTGVYDVLNAPNLQEQGNQSLWGRGMHYMMMLGDELTPFLDVVSTPYLRDVASCAYNSETQLATDVWFSLYVGIYRANNIIKHAPNIDMDEGRRDQIVAEAHFFRGFYGLYLAWLFGGIPLPQDPNEEAGPRLSIQETYSLIEQDLIKSYTTLSDRNIKGGRVNKWTAAGYLLKMYSYLASCKENNVGAELGFALNDFSWVNAPDSYQKALAIAQDAYTNSQYKLVSPYYSTFYADTKALQKEESLMLAQTGTGGFEEYFLFSYWTGPQGDITVDGGNYGWVRPLGELADRFDMADPRFTHNFTGHSGGSSTTEMIGGVRYYVPFPVNSIGNNLCFSKLRQSEPAARSQIGFPTWASNIDFPILRYADILLLYAEAAYKNGDEITGRNLLEEVRQRACIVDGQLNTALLNDLNQAYHRTDFMEELMDERSRELCGEGWRRIDLIRMGRMTSTIASISTSTNNGIYYYYNNQMATIKSNYEPNKIWFSIPLRETVVNPSLLPNNPGY